MEEAQQENAVESVEEEVVPVENGVEEAPQEEAQSAVASQIETNMANLRRAKEAAERERDEMRAQINSKSKPQRIEIGDDDLAEGRHLKEVRTEVRQALSEMRIKTNFPDFDKVVNADTVARFRTAYPELASTLASSQNQYDQAASAYTLIKKLGIYENEDHVQNQKLVQSNTAKPRPLTSMSPQQGDSPLAQANAFANGLTSELKTKLYREMMEARNKS